jgi:hypothetical protein
LGSKGNVWQGEPVETNEEPGWAEVVLEDAPSSGGQPGSGV